MANTGSAQSEKPWYKKWWVWALVIFGVLILAVALVPAAEEDTALPEPSTTTTMVAVEFMEWSIDTGDNTTLLRGERPNGYPTETWLNGQMLSRDEDGDFSWDLDREVPIPVSLQDDMDCEQLQADVEFWQAGAEQAIEDGLFDSAARQASYSQNAINLRADMGC